MKKELREDLEFMLSDLTKRVSDQLYQGKIDVVEEIKNHTLRLIDHYGNEISDELKEKFHELFSEDSSLITIYRSKLGSK